MINKINKSRLRIAIQKSGRLSEDSENLLKNCGIKARFNRQFMVVAENMPIDILRVRDEDIPGLIFDGVVDLGIVGGNVLEEEHLSRIAKNEDSSYQLLRRLDFGECRLSLAIPEDETYLGSQDFMNKRIATTYPHLLKRYFQAKNVAFKICSLNGAVEIAPHAGLADAICDLVSSGATLEANGLKEVEAIYQSKACFIQRAQALEAPLQALTEKLLMRIDGVIQARESKYIMMHVDKNNLEAVIALLPGAERPTLLPLANDEQKVALHMVSKETLFWETMEALKNLGASSILVLPIEKMLI